MSGSRRQVTPAGLRAAARPLCKASSHMHCSEREDRELVSLGSKPFFITIADKRDTTLVFLRKTTRGG